MVELLVALVAVGVLTAVAMPAFMESMRKGRRSDAFAAISAAQQAQERWRSTNSQYTTALADLGIAATSSAGYYQISLAPVPGDTLSTAYAVSAVAVAGTTQAADSQCSSLSVRVRGGTVEYAGCGGACGAFVYAPTNPCWSR
jgi:type IV pilus assembly protein PilE